MKYNTALISLKCSTVTADLALGGCICYLVFAEQLNLNRYVGSSLINDNEPIINNSLSIHKILRFPMLLKRFVAKSRHIMR